MNAQKLVCPCCGHDVHQTGRLSHMPYNLLYRCDLGHGPFIEDDLEDLEQWIERQR